MERDQEKPSLILGLWDGHDAGVAILRDDEIVYLANEERFSRRKLEPHFPYRSIESALWDLNIQPHDISHVYFSTTDISKTLTRLFPKLKEKYYQIRRRLLPRSKPSKLLKQFKYRLTVWPSNFLSAYLSRVLIKKILKRIGICGEVRSVNHHMAHLHAAAACAPSTFKDNFLCLIVDGVGDGASGIIAVIDAKTRRPQKILSTIAAKDSLGIFYEHATNLLGMRELEDEGKVMALADFSKGIKKNPFVGFFDVQGLNVHANLSSLDQYSVLEKNLKLMSREDFAFCVQEVLEIKCLQLISNALSISKLSDLVFSGGVAANVKLNRKIRMLNSCRKLWIFPHMGDGGLALGAALSQHRKIIKFSPFHGPKIEDVDLEVVLRSHSNIKFEKCDDIALEVSQRLVADEIVFWFQGQMEFGPRALGHRSILARPDKVSLKNELNERLKRRDEFQPFCPSMLASEASRLLVNKWDEGDLYMTCANYVREEYRPQLEAVIHIDGTCRPQIIEDDCDDIIFSSYLKLLKYLKESIGLGVVLNTSFNIHGHPLICTPKEAVDVFLKTDVRTMAIDNYLVSKR